ncbi:hypothetical protein Godav_004225 [Gossypium davidsonii]|uniref:Uncharacterized protein n=2 Tax=Gossypium TaxID=3633 RepID=A0A7J8SKC1_GOSDV|nr:hypothetical protein [Gossypium davidsonii]MBA0662195.1 hypothetical protein [Gossypium klotzschianum]
MGKAKYLLQQKDYMFKTDGRRILAYHSGIIEEKDEESIRLLKKLADMEIEDFPHDITKKSCNVEAIIKAMMMQAVMEATMTQVVMEAAINSSMQRGNTHDHAIKEAKRHKTWKQPHP